MCWHTGRHDNTFGKEAPKDHVLQEPAVASLKLHSVASTLETASPRVAGGAGQLGLHRRSPPLPPPPPPPPPGGKALALACQRLSIRPWMVVHAWMPCVFRDRIV